MIKRMLDHEQAALNERYPGKVVETYSTLQKKRILSAKP